MGRPCPVCGSCEHPSPASLAEHSITEQEFENLKASEESARNQKDEDLRVCQEYKVQVEERESVLRRDISSCLDLINQAGYSSNSSDEVKFSVLELDSKELLESSDISHLEELLKNASLSLKGYIESEKQEKKRLTALNSELIQSEREIKELESEISIEEKQRLSLEEDFRKVEREIAGLTATLENLSDLAYSSLDDAREEQEKLSKLISSITKDIDELERLGRRVLSLWQRQVLV